MSWLQRITIAVCLIWIAYMVSTLQNLANFLSQNKSHENEKRLVFFSQVGYNVLIFEEDTDKMPDIPYKVPSTGETRYRHITSGQQRLMSKLKWEQTVARQRAEKLRAEQEVLNDVEPQNQHYHGDYLYNDDSCWICDDIALMESDQPQEEAFSNAGA